MNKWKRIISMMMVTALVVSASGYGSIPARAEETQEKKSYVIVAETDEAYEAAAEEVGDSITVETPVLSENNVIVAELTEQEAEALEDRDILVEEDIVLKASTAEENGELTLEEARKRKEEIKQKKIERCQARESEQENQEEAEYEWNLQAIHADEAAEDAGKETQKVKVAVLDSGVDFTDGIELAGYVNLVEEEDYVAPIFQDLTGHGTGIAGIIAGNGEDGLYGVNPNAGVYSVKVLDENNAAPLSRIIRGIYWCIENNMNIINMSFGTPVYSKALEQAVADAYQAGLLMVGAAGNGSGDVEYPAAFPEVMAVAATTPTAELCDFSNTGKELDIAAPGEKIRVASFFGGSIVTHGTSVAVPHVTGVASLLWEKDLSKSNEFIRQLLSSSAKEIDGVEECGLLDAGYALECYDAFAETYDETKSMPAITLPENTAEPDVFEDVDTDETYVEGLWGGTNHKGAIDTHAGASGLTASAIKIVKQGAVYPDKEESGWKDAAVNPRWHGRWKEKYNQMRDVNYAAVLEMVTEVATEGGNVKSYMTLDWFDGMESWTYSALKSDINNLKSKYASLLSSDTTENRKYFLYGCGIHSIQDAFSHSTVDKSGNTIVHTTDNSTNADNIDYYPRRYKVATSLTKLLLENLQLDVFSNGADVLEAIDSTYQNATWRMHNVRKYIKANIGYSKPILSQITFE